MRKIRVLITDDSVGIRKILSDVIKSDPDLEVVGLAANGKIALAKIAQVQPDIVTLDVEMPVMDGLEALAEIRKTNPKLPVIMFSTLTERGAEATLDALALGANDYVTKPSNVSGFAEAMEHVRAHLIPRIKAFVTIAPTPEAPAAAAPAAPAPAPVAPPPVAPRRRPAQRRRIDIVAIGVSTGGPNALGDLMPAFPRDFPVPIVIVQHMPPVFTKSLADRLSAKSAIDVYEGQEGDVVKPGTAWLAPGGFHMVLNADGTKTTIGLHEGPQENSCRPAADVLFRSVAARYGPHVLGIVMTGMGKDGLLGSELITNGGGIIWVQDEASSVVWAMPGFIANAGLAERVLPLDSIGPEVARRVMEQRDRVQELAG